MGFSSLLGQPGARQTLERALSIGRVHHAYRFVGPAGVGKETAAFLLAQALVCEVPTPFGCGACSACRRALNLAESEPHVPKHPDVVLLGRKLYPAALLGGSSETSGISVEQIRRIVLARVGMPPHEARSLVFIMRDADELTAAAANALLKTLEEPRKNVHFILLTSRPAKLLDTILSRTLAVRFGPLPENELRVLLDREGIDPDLAPFSQGSVERARLLSDPDTRANQDAFVTHLDQALATGTTAAALAFSEKRPDGRDELTSLLAHAATIFAGRARESGDIKSWSFRYQLVVNALREVERNGSPGLVLESMLLSMMQCRVSG